MRSHIWAIVGGLAALGAARRYYRNWGTTKDECQMPLPGDDLVAAPSTQMTDAVSIERSATEIWPWLMRWIQDRTELCQGQRITSGDVIRMAPLRRMGLDRDVVLTIADIVDDHTIVLQGVPPQLPWTVVWSFHLLPRGEDRCRLLVRTRIALRHPGEAFLAEAAGPLLALTTRNTLRRIQRRAEGSEPTAPVDQRQTSSPPARDPEAANT
ncbi:MAG: SRPBCC family protein [Mycobacterium sp.]